MGGGGGQEDLSDPEIFFAYFWSRRIFFKAIYFHFMMRKVISKVCNVVLGVSKAVYRVWKADFGQRKQILDCEGRFRTAKCGFWSAKTGCRVPKRFVRQARKKILPALQAREFFSPEIRAGIFFLRSLPAPPPLKIKWLLPYIGLIFRLVKHACCSWLF